MTEVTLPDLGEGITEAVIAAWLIKEGEEVDTDNEIVEVVTDKASFSIPAPCKGRVIKICIPEGGKVAVGATLAVIE